MSKKEFLYNANVSTTNVGVLRSRLRRILVRSYETMSSVSLCVHITFETSASNCRARFSAQETAAFGKCAFELHFFFSLVHHLPNELIFKLIVTYNVTSMK